MASWKLIQGGMGVGVSGWRLARVVSKAGQLGVVSGTGLAALLARRLQNGDAGGHMRRAISHFPIPGVAERILDCHFIDGGRPADEPFILTTQPRLSSGVAFTELTVVANFVEVYLAKEGHDGSVGINYLEKVQIPTLPSIFGAMLAGVDVILMGAGIPRFIPGVLDAFAEGKPAELHIQVEDAGDRQFISQFDPSHFCEGQAPPLSRPLFLAIISSATLAMTLARKSNGRVDGFIVEAPCAGGHNAPPRGQHHLSPSGEPVYGPRDEVDLDKLRALELPFWLAGGFATPEQLANALALGAVGVQVGTLFAFSHESDLTPAIKQQVLEQSRRHEVTVFTDPLASPTGFPFKVVQTSGSLSDHDLYLQRPRICDLAYLCRPYLRPDGVVGYRCPAEPEAHYVKKGGDIADTIGRKCVCNALFGSIGLGQVQPSGDLELALVTAGDDVAHIARLIAPGQDSYSAMDVVRYMLAAPASAVIIEPSAEQKV